MNAPQATTSSRSALRAWFDDAAPWLAQRQLRQASEHAQRLALEIEAVRRNHTSSAHAASQALDRFVCALRNVQEIMIGPEHSEEQSQDLAWLEPAIALQRNFELQERSWSAGLLAGADFMSGHEVLTRDTLAQMSHRLGLAPELPPATQDARGLVGLPADASNEPSSRDASSNHAAQGSGSSWTGSSHRLSHRPSSATTAA